jgi:hypothetical protein
MSEGPEFAPRPQATRRGTPPPHSDWIRLVDRVSDDDGKIAGRAEQRQLLDAGRDKPSSSSISWGDCGRSLRDRLARASAVCRARVAGAKRPRPTTDQWLDPVSSPTTPID